MTKTAPKLWASLKEEEMSWPIECRNNCIKICDDHLDSLNIVWNILAEEHRRLHADGIEAVADIYLKEDEEVVLSGRVVAKCDGSNFVLPLETGDRLPKPNGAPKGYADFYKIDLINENNEVVDVNNVLANGNIKLTYVLTPYIKINYLDRKGALLEPYDTLKGTNYDIDSTSPYSIEGNDYYYTGKYRYTLTGWEPNGVLTNVTGHIDVVPKYSKDTYLSIYLYDKPEEYTSDYNPGGGSHHRRIFRIRKGGTLIDGMNNFLNENGDVFPDHLEMVKNDVFEPFHPYEWHYKDNTDNVFDPSAPLTESTYLVGAWFIRPTYEARYEESENGYTSIEQRTYPTTVTCGDDISEQVKGLSERKGYEFVKVEEGTGEITYKKHHTVVVFRRKECLVTWKNPLDDSLVKFSKRVPYGTEIRIDRCDGDKYPEFDSYYDENTNDLYDNFVVDVENDSETPETYSLSKKDSSTTVIVTKDLTIKCSKQKTRKEGTVTAKAEIKDITDYDSGIEYQPVENQPSPFVKERTYNLPYELRGSWQIKREERLNVQAQVDELEDQLHSLYANVSKRSNSAWKNTIDSDPYIGNFENFKTFANQAKTTMEYSKFNVCFKAINIWDYERPKVDDIFPTINLSGGYIGYYPQWPTGYDIGDERTDADGTGYYICDRDETKPITKNSPQTTTYVCRVRSKPHVGFYFGENAEEALLEEPEDYILTSVGYNPIKDVDHDIEYPEIPAYNEEEWTAEWIPSSDTVGANDFTENIFLNFIKKPTNIVKFSYRENAAEALGTSDFAEPFATVEYDPVADNGYRVRYPSIPDEYDDSVWEVYYRPASSSNIVGSETFTNHVFVDFIRRVGPVLPKHTITWKYYWDHECDKYLSNDIDLTQHDCFYSVEEEWREGTTITTSYQPLILSDTEHLTKSWQKEFPFELTADIDITCNISINDNTIYDGNHLLLRKYNSWTSDQYTEIEIYPKTQTINLGACPSKSKIDYPDACDEYFWEVSLVNANGLTAWVSEKSDNNILHVEADKQIVSQTIESNPIPANKLYGIIEVTPRGKDYLRYEFYDADAERDDTLEGQTLLTTLTDFGGLRIKNLPEIPSVGLGHECVGWVNQHGDTIIDLQQLKDLDKNEVIPGLQIWCQEEGDSAHNLGMAHDPSVMYMKLYPDFD